MRSGVFVIYWCLMLVIISSRADLGISAAGNIVMVVSMMGSALGIGVIVGTGHITRVPVAASAVYFRLTLARWSRML